MDLHKLGLDETCKLFLSWIGGLPSKHLHSYSYPLDFVQIQQDAQTHGSGKYRLLVTDRNGRFIKNHVFEV